MSKRKRAQSRLLWTWASIVLLLLLLDQAAAATATPTESQDVSVRKYCDSCQQLTTTTPKPPKPKEDDEDPENDYKMWLAILESLREWKRRKANRTAVTELPPELDFETAIYPVAEDHPHHTPRSRKRRDEESVCYGRKEFCFKDKGPFDYLDTLPASPEAIGTTFKLYTNKNRPDPVKETGQYLDYDNATTLLISNFNATRDVKIIIHGFGSSSRRPWVLNITKALLDLDDFNVINVDWENGAKMPNYVQAAANTQLVGKQIAALIRLINYLTKLSPSRYHLIGFSLGAHVAGFTGKEFRNPNISRITGLDPAAPLFEGYEPGVRLDETDANFVDVIHSNGDGFIRGGLGSYTPMGHVDFYPNGGRVQVGCNSVLMGAITDIISGKWNSLCNHRRAFRFFLDSFKRSCQFHAFQCSSYEDFIRGHCFTCGPDGRGCSSMGYFAHLSKARGKMYLITREGGGETTKEDQNSFCGNQFRIRVDSSRDGQSVTWGKVEIVLVSSNGLNETFTLSGESEELKEGEKIQALIVAHSELTNVTEAILSYTKYKGWIYNGKADWNIDRIEILDSTGKIKSYCHPRTKLMTTLPLRVPLAYGNCTALTPLPLLADTANALVTVPVASQLVPSTGHHHSNHLFNRPPPPPYHPGAHYPPGPAPSGPVPPPIYPGPGFTLRKPPSEVSPGESGGGENDIDGSPPGAGGNSGASGPSSAGSPESTWGFIVRKYGNFFSYDDSLDAKRGGSGNRTELADAELMENQIGPRLPPPPVGTSFTNGPPTGDHQQGDGPEAGSSGPSTAVVSPEEPRPKPSQSTDFNEDSGSNQLRSSEETDDFVPMMAGNRTSVNSDGSVLGRLIPAKLLKFFSRTVDRDGAW